MEVCYDAFIHHRSDSPTQEAPPVSDRIGATINDLISCAKVDYNITQYLIVEYKRLYEELQVMMREAHAEYKSRDESAIKNKVIRNFLSYCYALPEYNISGYKYPNIGVSDIYANCAELICGINEKLFQLKYQSEIIVQFIRKIENNPILCMRYMRQFDSRLYLQAK